MFNVKKKKEISRMIPSDAHPIHTKKHIKFDSFIKNVQKVYL